MAKSLESDFYLRFKFYSENLFFLLASYFCSPFLYSLIAINNDRNKHKKGKLKILVIQIAKIGDMVCTTPIFREIKKHLPDCELTALVLSKTRGIISGNPYIDKIMILDHNRYQGILGKIRLARDLAKDKYDWSVSFNTTLINNIVPFWSLIPERVSFTSEHAPKSCRLSFVFSNHKKEFLRDRPAFKQYLGLLEFLGIKNADGKKEIFLSKESRRKASDFLLENRIGEKDFLIGISVSSGNPIKDWGLEKFAELSDKLINNLKAKIIFVGGEDDKNSVKEAINLMKNSAIDAVGFFKLGEVGALLERLKLFIGVDTGPLYLASALGVPVIDIIGPFNVIEQMDPDSKYEIVSKKLYCFPCIHIIPSVYFCKEGHFRCTRDISIEDVYKAALRLKDRCYL